LISGQPGLELGHVILNYGGDDLVHGQQGGLLEWPNETVEKPENELAFQPARFLDKILDACATSFLRVTRRLCQRFSMQFKRSLRCEFIVPHIASY
jgi:hypothetical protein